MLAELSGQWLSMLHTVDHEPGKNKDRTSIEPLQSEDAAKLGKLAFQTLQTQLETEARILVATLCQKDSKRLKDSHMESYDLQ